MNDISELVVPEDRASLAVLAQRDLPEVDTAIPAPDELLTRALATAIGFDDQTGLLAVADRLRAPDAQALLRLEVGALVEAMGRTESMPPLPAVTRDLVDPPGYFWLHVALLALPYVRAYHRDHGVDEATSWRTLTDLGRNVAVYRNRHHRAGFDDPSWLRLHLTGLLYDLGRLQFNRAQLGGTYSALMRDRGLDAVHGEPCLGVHIPRYAGPMGVADCDASFARAATFFPTHFPHEHPRYVVCSSWLLDPVLADYLPEHSNILAFQRRFTLVRNDEPDDEGPLAFVFDDPTRPHGDYPRASSLQRAVLDHLEAGEHWHGARGWARIG